MRGVLWADMKSMNTAKIAGTVMISMFLLTSCVTVPFEDRQSSARENMTAGASDSTANILPPADNSEHGKCASQIVDCAIKGAINLLRAYPADNVFSGATKAGPRRDQLTESGRVIYDMLFSAVEKIGGYEWDSVKYGENAFSDFMAADEALRADHPRFRAYYYPDVAGDVFRPIYFLPGNSYDSPTDDTEEIADRIALFDAVCQRIIDCIPDGLSDLGKYRYFAAVVTELCEYDRSLSTVGLPYPAYNALVNGRAVCSGYASAFEHLCSEIGLFCQRTDGTKDGSDHAWNRICLSGSFYYCDLTAAKAERPGSDAWLQCIAITAERANSENYRPFREGMMADGTDEIK